MKKMMMTVGLLAAMAGGVNAAPLKTSQVAGDARFVLHLDVEALKETQVGKILMQRLTTGKDNNNLNALALILGFDMRRDLNGLTVFGPPGAGEEGVMILNGKFNAQQLETFVMANEDYTGEGYKGSTVHSWTDKKKNNKRSYGAILGGSTIVMGDSQSGVKAALDAMSGQGQSIATLNSSKLALSAANNAVLIGAADMAKTQGSKAQTIKNAKSGAIAVREEGADAVIAVTLEAANSEAARHMSDAVRGLLAIMQLDDKTDQKTKDALAATKLDLNGDTLNVTVRMSAQTLADGLQKQFMKEDAKRAAAKGEALEK